MAIYKCKMCGAKLEVAPGSTIATCSFCSSKQTVANADDERKENLYNRANTLRLNCEFDKALLAYQSILTIFPNDSEAHWGVTLCKYGIEYVDDPLTKKKKPTIHRMSFDSILKDLDYQDALFNADVIARSQYEEEANEIAVIQNNILTISQKEKPFDIFICYKETDEFSKRTKDSVMGQEIYNELIEKGYKVFFSRVSLENKLGTMFEPYIFAALNSAKIMLVIGTKKEYFESVWVKNEWSRFINIMQTRPDHYLIPCYKDMNAYEMPEEFLMFQAQDLGKLGFMQDLMRGIDKIMGKEEQKNVAPVTISEFNLDSISLRIEMLIADKQFFKADELVEKILNNDPRNSKAYLYKVLCELNITSIENLKKYDEPIDDNYNYKKSLEFANGQEKKILESIDKAIKNNIEEKRNSGIYNQALSYRNNNDYLSAIELFNQIENYKDSNALKEEVLKKYNETTYKYAKELMEKKIYALAEKELEKIPTYLDASNLLEECRRKQNEMVFRHAMVLKEKMKYDEAISALTKIIGFENVKDEIEICKELKRNEHKEKIYVSCLLKGDVHSASFIKEIKEACKKLATIKEYKNASQIISEYVNIIKNYEKELELAREEKKKRRKVLLKKIKIYSFFAFIIAIITTIISLLTNFYFIPEDRQNKIYALIDQGKYEEAFSKLENNHYGDYKNQIKMCIAGEAFSNLDYETGIHYMYNADGTIEVKYYSNDGNAIKDNEIIKKSKNYIDNDCDKFGYVFNGWVLKNYEMKSAKHYVSLELEAQFEIYKYSLTLDLEGGFLPSPVPSYYTIDDRVEIPNPNRFGYEFLGWTTTGVETPTVDFVIEKGSVGNKTLIANWKAKEYTIFLDSNKGILDKNEVSVTYDENFNLHIPTAIETGYIFEGWYDENGNKYKDGIYILDNDLYLIARYIENPNTPYKVINHFESIDGTFYVKDKEEERYGKAFSTFAIEPSIYEGFTPLEKLKEIYVEPDGTGVVDFYYKRNTYELSFISNGGIQVENIKLKYEEKIPSSIVTTRENSIFDGWYLDDNGLKKIESMPSKDTTLFAYYKDETKISYLDATYSLSNACITSGKSLSGIIKIPLYINDKLVTRIDKYAFEDNKQIIEVNLNDNIELIDDYAFKGCSLLETINGMENFSTINEGVFEDCTNLKNIDLTNVTTINTNAFKNCSSLKEVNCNELRFIGEEAFMGCSSLEKIPDLTNVTFVGNNAFNGCSSIKEVRLENGGITIGDQIFSNCENIQKIYVEFKNNIEQFYVARLFGREETLNDKFYASKVEDDLTYYIPKSLKVIELYGCGRIPDYFLNGIQDLESFVCDFEAITEIGNYAFANCYFIESFNVPKTIKVIGKNAFENCDNLSSLTFENDSELAQIGNYAFKNCSLITSLVIPNSVTYIGLGAFEKCSSLNNLTLPKFVNELNSTTHGYFGYIFGGIKIGDNSLVPANLKYVTITNGVILASNAFNSCTNIIEIKLPDSLQSINNDAFSNCSSLKRIVIPYNVRTISSRVFENCTNLETVIFEKGCSVTSFRNNLFNNCTSLKYISLPEIERIETEAFNNCISLESIILPETLKSIGTYAFYSCSSLKTLVIPQNVNTISSGILSKCNSLESLTISCLPKSSSISYFGYMFGASSVNGNDVCVPKSLKEIKILDGTNICESFFENCNNIESIYIPNSITSIGMGAFKNCSSLKKIVLPFIGSSITSSTTINYCFGYIFGASTNMYNRYFVPSTLEEVTITNETAISTGDFYDCRNIKSIILTDTITSIGIGAFEKCSSLRSITLPFVGESNSESGTTNFGYIFGAETNSLNNQFVPSTLEKVIILGGERIDNEAFKDCFSLKKVYIPKSISFMGRNIFFGCDELDIYCEVEAPLETWDGFWNATYRPVHYGYSVEQMNNL